MISIDILDSLLLASVVGLFGFFSRDIVQRRIQSRLSAYMREEMYAILEDLPTFLEENPQIIRNVSKPFISALMSQFGASTTEGGELKDLKIGGFKVPAWLVQMGMQYFGSPQKAKSTAESIIHLNE